MRRKSKKRKKRMMKIKKQNFILAKGLSRMEAYEKAKKKSVRDYRCFSYNPKTGKAFLI